MDTSLVGVAWCVVMLTSACLQVRSRTQTHPSHAVDDVETLGF